MIWREPVETIPAGLVTELQQILGPTAVLAAETDRMVYECDGYLVEKRRPELVVLPATTEEVAATVQACNRWQVPFVPRGAGTSLSGSTIPLGGGVMIVLTRMNRILQLDWRNRFAVVQPGVVNLLLNRALSAHGFHYAPDPSSQGACTIGGNIATNSGGPHTLKYGVTVNHILGAEFVLPDGAVVQFGGPVEDPAGYDLLGVLVGGEGTLGICTRAWVRLTVNPQAYRTLLCIFSSIDDACATVSEIISAGILPAALELMDREITRAVENAFHFGFPEDLDAVLIIEVDGPEAGLDEEADRIAAIAQRHQAKELRQARTAAERDLLWKCRKKAFGALGRLAPSYCCQDGVVPRTQIPQIMRFIREVAERYRLRIVNVFHAGDGNVHPILLFTETNPDEVERVLAASREILGQCVALGGTVTGEHGIGIEKIEFMEQMFSPADLRYFAAIRDLFNPHRLCNRFKILPGEYWTPRPEDIPTVQFTGVRKAT